MPIRFKVLIVPLMLVMAIIMVSSLSIYGLKEQQQTMAAVNDITLKRITLINEFKTLSEQVQSNLFRISVLRSMNLPKQEIAPAQTNLTQGLSDLNVIYGQMLIRWQLDIDEFAILKRMKESLSKFRLQAKQAAVVVVKNPSFGVLLVRSSAASFDDFSAMLATLLDYEMAKVIRTTEASNIKTQELSLAIVVLVLLIAIAAAIVTIMLSARLISGPIGLITRMMHRLADGDLSMEVSHLERSDEIGEMAHAVDVFRSNAIEKEKMDQALQESEKRYRLLFMRTPAGVFHYNSELFVTDCNDRLATILKSTRQKLIGFDLRGINDQRLMPTLYEISKAEEGFYEGPYLSTTGTGNEIWLTLRTSPLFDQRGHIVGGVGLMEDITEKKQAEEMIKELSLRDSLTSLYNRRGFVTLAEQKLKDANREKKSLRLIFIDCDDLKWINDTLGHSEGDNALVDTADVLEQTFRESDVISRLGGDEYAVLTTHSTDIETDIISKRIQLNVDAINAQPSRPYKLSMSWGVAIYDPNCPVSLDELMSQADKLMYINKEAKKKSCLL